jgi:hypothetical protein
VEVSLARKAAPRSMGLVCAQRAAHPATCEAILVPLIVLCNVGRGHDEKTLTPGSAMSILPPFRKDCHSKRAVERVNGDDAGRIGGGASGLNIAGAIAGVSRRGNDKTPCI